MEHESGRSGSIVILLELGEDFKIRRCGAHNSPLPVGKRGALSLVVRRPERGTDNSLACNAESLLYVHSVL
jgi:hypothetical protein